MKRTFLNWLSRAGLEFFVIEDQRKERPTAQRELVYEAMRKAMVEEQNFCPKWFDKAVERAETLVTTEKE